MTRKTIALLVGLVVSLGAATVGCDASKPSGAPRPHVTAGLRGVALRKLSCTPRPKAPGSDVVAIGSAEEFLVCRSGLRGAPRRALSVTATEPKFQKLLTALAAPNAPPTTEGCLVLSEVQIVLLARTPTGAFRVLIPLDGCGLYQKAALDVIYGAQARATTGARQARGHASVATTIDAGGSMTTVSWDVPIARSDAIADARRATSGGASSNTATAKLMTYGDWHRVGQPSVITPGTPDSLQVWAVEVIGDFPVSMGPAPAYHWGIWLYDAHTGDIVSYVASPGAIPSYWDGLPDHSSTHRSGILKSG